MGRREWWRHKLSRMWPGLPADAAEFGRSVRDDAANLVRFTVATVLAFVVTRNLFSPGTVDLTGALAALLISRASLRGSFRAGMVRVIAVTSGVLLALLVATAFGLHWWSLGLVVLGGMILARLLHIESESLEVAISAMLILGASGTEAAAWQRFAATMIGTLIGIVVPLVLPRRVRVSHLTASLDTVVARLAGICASAASHLVDHRLTARAATRWLDDTYHVSPLIAQAGQVLSEADDLKRFNTRQIYDADVVPLLRGHLARMERTHLALRHLFLVIQARGDEAVPEPASRILGECLRDLAEILRGFGELVEADTHGELEASDRVLERILAAREQLEERIGCQDPQWAECAGWLGPAVEQVVLQLDLASHVERRDQWRSSQLGRVLPGGRIGPRIRSPWGLVAQRRLHDRAERSRRSFPEGSHEVQATDTTMLMPAVEERPGLDARD